MKFVSSEVRRARPLLGTFVEIRVQGGQHDRLHPAIDRAFNAIERVHHLMSFHDPASDVSRLNQMAAKRPVAVDPWTNEVLREAQYLSTVTNGDFDITVAPLLRKWGYLPRQREKRPFTHRIAGYRNIKLLARNRVRFHDSAVLIDLGGIAKGFAVDQAIRVLKAENVDAALVNAGGDLRTFGSYPVEIRHPNLNCRGLIQLSMENSALATSGNYFARKHWRGQMVGPLISPHEQIPCLRFASVSVRAESCLQADALTKIVMLRGPEAFPLLQEFAAEAVVVTNDKGLVFSSGWHQGMHKLPRWSEPHGHC